MKSELKCFLENLILHFSGREEIYHVHYDGESEPKLVAIKRAMNILSGNSIEAINKWVAQYISRRNEINYYEMYQHFVNEYYDLWVNPTLEELTIWNKNMDLFPMTNLMNTQSYKKEWEETIHQKLVDELKALGYSVVSGSQLIEHLVHSYDHSDVKNISIVDWIKPTDISLLKNNHSYIIDSDLLTKPVLLTMQHILERDNHEFPIHACHLRLYLENIEVTKRGIDSEERVEDRDIVFYYYNDIEDYISSLDHENEDTTLRKLIKHEVDPKQPFIEAVINDYSENYIKADALKTEKDLLDFANESYLLEEIDREAKSFNRIKIMDSLLCQTVCNNTNITIRRKDSIH